MTMALRPKKKRKKTTTEPLLKKMTMAHPQRMITALKMRMAHLLPRKIAPNVRLKARSLCFTLIPNADPISSHFTKPRKKNISYAAV